MKQGVLVYDQWPERMDTHFGLKEYYSGLHCGTCMDVKLGSRLEPAQIEHDREKQEWCLVDVPADFLIGLIVRLA